MSQPGSSGVRRASRVAVGLAVVAVLVSIGTPLVGLRVFAGTDLLEGFAPWDEVPPDAEVSNPLVSDLVDSSLPDRRQAVARLHDGDLPLWQPYANGGRPLAALPNLGLASPLNWPYLVLPLWFAPAVVQLLTMLVSLAGGLAWLRRTGVGWAAAALGASTVTFSGFAVVYAGFPAGHIAALLPVGLWAADVATDDTRGPARRILPLAAVVAAMWFEGFPQVTAFALAAMGLWAVAALADRRPSEAGSARAAGWVGPLSVPLAAVALGTMLAAVQLLPFAADTADLDLSAREQTAADHLPAATAVTVVAPDALGTTQGGDWFGPDNEIEVQAAIAVPALVLALVGLAGAPRGRRWRTGAVTAMAAGAATLTWVGGPLLAAAQATPLFALAGVHRVRLLVVIGVAFLAAQGADRIRRGGAVARGERVAMALLAVAAAGAVAFVGVQARRTAPSLDAVADLDRSVALAAGVGVVTVAVAGLAWWRPRWQAAGGVALVALTIAVALPLPLRFWPRTDRALFYPSTPAHQYLASHLGHDRLLTDGLTMLPGTTTWYGLRTAAAHAFPTPAWRDLLEAVDPAVYERLSPTFPAVALTPQVAASPVLDRLAVRYLVRDPDGDPWPTGTAPVVHDGDARVHERPEALARIRWAGRAEVVPDADDRVARVADPDLPDDTVVLSAAPDAAAATGSSTATLDVVRDRGDTIEVDVASDGPGWLVVMDTLDDWTAQVDGEPAEIVAADHAGGAVALGPGSHRVVLSYTPSGWRAGVTVSAIALLALAAVGAAGWRGRRRGAGHDAAG